MSLYTDKVMDHFKNPRNVGEIENASGVGTVGNAKCGDIMRMYLDIDGNVIKDVKFKTFGCGAAIATSSMATELVKGKTIVCGHSAAAYGNARVLVNPSEWNDKKYDNIQRLKKDLSNIDLYKPFYGDCVIGIDSNVYKTGFVNCIVVEEKEYGK